MRNITVLILAGALGFATPVMAQHGHAATQKSLEMNQAWSEQVEAVAGAAARFESPTREVIARRDAIVAAMDLKPGEAVADVGAGTGAYLKALAEAVGSDGHVYAVDISAPFVAHMRDRIGTEGLTNVSVILSRVDNPTLPPRALDSILVVNTFHHFEAPEAMLSHFLRALKPGGELVIVDFDLAAGHAGHRDVVALDKQGHVQLIEAHGFRVLEDVQTAGLKENFLLRFIPR